MTPTKIYWEDLKPGTVHALGSVTTSAEAMIAFAQEFDPQPFHLDEEAGEASIFGGLCASGWLPKGGAAKRTRAS